MFNKYIYYTMTNVSEYPHTKNIISSYYNIIILDEIRYLRRVKLIRSFDYDMRIRVGNLFEIST